MIYFVLLSVDIEPILSPETSGPLHRYGMDLSPDLGNALKGRKKDRDSRSGLKSVR